MYSVTSGCSVFELNQMIAESLRADPRLRSVTVTAEISGFKHHAASGHWYFLLKDACAAISCVMFRQNNVHSGLYPRDGDRVTVRGYVEFYGRDGKVQLYVMEMKAAGLGSLYEQFEILKQKLKTEGLFDPGRKRLLPQIPRKVAVITSASGAALHDILNVSGQRSPFVPIVLIPSAVQGPGAAKELVSALEKVPLIPDVEAVIIGRGGGSPEDLWCFNEEIVARAVAACPVPVVSGVGHETDFTICDYAADIRASTPSNAAEIVFPDREELMGKVQLFRTELVRSVSGRLHGTVLQVLHLKDRIQKLSPESVLHSLLDRTHQTRQRLNNAIRLELRERENDRKQTQIRLNYGIERLFASREHELDRIRTALQAISPMNVLERGYAMVFDPEGKVIPDAEAAGKQRDMEIRFRDGTVHARRKE